MVEYSPVKQKQFPLFENANSDPFDAVLQTIDTASPRDLLPILTHEGITTPNEERRRWDEGYGYTEEGGHYHWLPFLAYLEEQRPYYRDVVLRVRDGTAKNYAEAKEQIDQAGRENLRTLIRELRRKLKNTTQE